MKYTKPKLTAQKFTLSRALLADDLSIAEDINPPGFHDDDNTGTGPGSEIIPQIFENIFSID